MRILIYSTNCSIENERKSENSKILYNFLTNNRDLIPKICYYKNDSDIQSEVINELTMFLYKIRKTNLDAEFVRSLINEKRDAFIFCDNETVEQILIKLYKIINNKNIILNVGSSNMIEINNTYQCLKFRSIDINKLYCQ